jgi:hypothetical protein
MLREWMKYGEGATLPVMIELDLRGGLDLRTGVVHGS